MTFGDEVLEALQDHGDNCTARALDRERELQRLRSSLDDLQAQVAHLYRLNSAADQVHRKLQNLSDEIGERLDQLEGLTGDDLADLREHGRLASQHQRGIRATVRIGVNHGTLQIGHRNQNRAS